MMGIFVRVNEPHPKSRGRLLGYVLQENGCWEWVGSHTGAGYGKIWRGGKLKMAHRVTYEEAKGPIPVGLTLDHLCRNRGCVNPDHLEPVTHRVNLLRGRSPSAICAKKTHCHKGHLFDTANTYLTLDGKRSCRSCHRAAERLRKKLLREARQECQ